MSGSFLNSIGQQLSEIETAGLLKTERSIASPQRQTVTVGSADVINLCANNYLGLANDPRLVQAAQASLDHDGYGMASVRFICGTHDLHLELERAIARFLGKDDAILFAACFDANGGLFEPLLGPDDAIISDALNHASIVDGVRLCKAKRFIYANRNMKELENCLETARTNGARHILIATDGVFSMDGTLAPLPEIVQLARKHDAVLMVDDCHATGFMGASGYGTHEHFDVMDRVDILTGTLGKALGGGLGGYVASSQPVIDLLRQHSRPYLFSNSLPPMICAASLSALRIVVDEPERRTRLFDLSCRWRNELIDLGFEVWGDAHPIVPIVLHDARLVQDFAAKLFECGVYAPGFFQPVVPHGKARIRTQMNATFSDLEIECALEAFNEVGRELGLI